MVIDVDLGESVWGILMGSIVVGKDYYGYYGMYGIYCGFMVSD